MWSIARSAMARTIGQPHSPRKSAAVEEGLLLRRGGAAQYGVAMGKPPETADDVGVLLGVFGEFIIAVAARELDATLLVSQLLRVLQRQIEELPITPRDLLVEAAGERPPGRGASKSVGFIRACKTAEHVARKLIEHDDQRQRALRRLLP